MRQFTDEQFNDLTDGQDYYQHVPLVDIVNDFMMSEVGEGMLIPNIAQHKVEFHAQRGLQELNYDTLRTVKTFEFEADGGFSFVLPQDLVGIVGVYWVDESGYKHRMYERIDSGNPQTVMTDEQGNPLYDQDGNYILGDGFTKENFDNRHSNTDNRYFNYYAGAFETDELYARYYNTYYGGRYGIEPTKANYNGTYIHDQEAHRIFIDTTLVDRPFIVDYVSDGLAAFDDIKVHKFAEEAIYAYIRFKLVYGMRNMPLYEKQLAKKEYVVAKRRAKHRLSDIGNALRQSLLGKTKWIKH